MFLLTCGNSCVRCTSTRSTACAKTHLSKRSLPIATRQQRRRRRQRVGVTWPSLYAPTSSRPRSSIRRWRCSANSGGASAAEGVAAAVGWALTSARTEYRTCLTSRPSRRWHDTVSQSSTYWPRRRWLQLWFDFDLIWFRFHLYYHSTTCYDRRPACSGLPHWDLNK